MEALHSLTAVFDIFGMVFQYFLNSFSRFAEIFQHTFSFIYGPVERIINTHPSFYYSLMMAGAIFGLYYLVSSVSASRAKVRKIRK